MDTHHSKKIYILYRCDPDDRWSQREKSEMERHEQSRLCLGTSISPQKNAQRGGTPSALVETVCENPRMQWPDESWSKRERERKAQAWEKRNEGREGAPRKIWREERTLVMSQCVCFSFFPPLHISHTHAPNHQPAVYVKKNMYVHFLSQQKKNYKRKARKKIYSCVCHTACMRRKYAFLETSTKGSTCLSFSLSLFLLFLVAVL